MACLLIAVRSEGGAECQRMQTSDGSGRGYSEKAGMPMPKNEMDGWGALSVTL